MDIKYVHFSNIDNLLVRPCDPLLFGMIDEKEEY